VIDSQSVRAAPTVPKASRGWDAAKKVNGRKRHIAVDTTGLLLDVWTAPGSLEAATSGKVGVHGIQEAASR
jgi:Transposase DDE domain